METGEGWMSMEELFGTGSRFENSIFSPRPSPIVSHLLFFDFFELCHRLFAVLGAVDILYKVPCTRWMSYGRLCLTLYPFFFSSFFSLSGQERREGGGFCIRGFFTWQNLLHASYERWFYSPLCTILI